jgi:hypothetical protein
MKDEEIKHLRRLNPLTLYNTLGGTGEVTRGEGRGEGADTTLLSHTPKYISLIICPDVINMSEHDKFYPIHPSKYKSKILFIMNR